MWEFTLKRSRYSAALLCALLLCAFGESRAQEKDIQPEPAYPLHLPCVHIRDLLYQKENGETVVYHQGTPFSGNACSYYADGKPHTETEYINGIKEGVYRTYFSNGLLDTEGQVRKGKEHGPYREYYNSGPIKYDYVYDMGQRTGVWMGYHRDGSRYTERHFAKDKLHGKVLVWDQEGNLVKEMTYHNGVMLDSRDYAPGK